MSTIYRRPRTRKKSGIFALPVICCLVVLALFLLGLGFLYKNKISSYFTKEPPIIVPTNEQANSNLEKLLADLAGGRTTLLELAESPVRLGWIESDQTRRQFRWMLMERLVDCGEWAAALKILPEVEGLANMEQLDRLAHEAYHRQDYELQMRLDSRLQELSLALPEKTKLLLRSIRRTSESAIRLQREGEALKAVARLDIPAVAARLTDPADAAEAASLILMRAKVSEVKAPVIAKVRNILQQAKWPACPATAQLILAEVTDTVRDKPNMSVAEMRETEAHLLKSRDAFFSQGDAEQLLPACYMLLGELRFRLADYDACVSALSLAGAFAEGYGTMTPDLRLRIARTRSLANQAAGNIEAALVDCRYLSEHETDLQERFRCLVFLASEAKGEARIERLNQCWKLLLEDENLAAKNRESRLKVAYELLEHYKAEEDLTRMCNWTRAAISILEEDKASLTDGVAFTLRLNMALALRKAKNDETAMREMRRVINAIEAMTESERERLDAAKPNLYKSAITELARSHNIRKEITKAKELMKKIGSTSLPNPVR